MLPNARVQTHTYIHMHAHVHSHACVNVHARAGAYENAHTCSHMRTHMHACLHTSTSLCPSVALSAHLWTPMVALSSPDNVSLSFSPPFPVSWSLSLYPPPSLNVDTCCSAWFAWWSGTGRMAGRSLQAAFSLSLSLYIYIYI
jgi:hypothetical protein